MLSDREIQMFNSAQHDEITQGSQEEQHIFQPEEQVLTFATKQQSQDNNYLKPKILVEQIEMPSTHRLFMKEDSDLQTNEMRASTYRPSNLVQPLDKYVTLAGRKEVTSHTASILDSTKQSIHFPLPNDDQFIWDCEKNLDDIASKYLQDNLQVEAKENQKSSVLILDSILNEDKTIGLPTVKKSQRTISPNSNIVSP